MYFKKIWVHQLPGVHKEFCLGPLSEGANVVLGANACGKTSICKAFRLGLWPNPKHGFLPLHVEFECEEGGRKGPPTSFKISVQDRKQQVFGIGGKQFMKALPEERWASCFSLVVDEVFDGGNQSFEQRVFHEFLGGYDLKKSLSSLTQKNTRVSVLLKDWQQAFRSAQQYQKQNELCLKECSQLPDLEEELRQVGALQKKNNHFLRVRDLYDLQLQIVALKEKQSQFPLAVQRGKIQPGDETVYERLLDERAFREKVCLGLQEKIHLHTELCHGCPEWSTQEMTLCFNLLDQLVSLSSKEKEYGQKSLQEQRKLQAHSRFLDLKSPLDHFSAKKAQDLYQLWSEVSSLQQTLHVMEEQVHSFGNTFSLYTLSDIVEGVSSITEKHILKNIWGVQKLLLLGGLGHFLGAIQLWWMNFWLYSFVAGVVSVACFFSFWKGVRRCANLDIQLSKRGFAFWGSVQNNYLAWIEKLLQKWGQTYVAQEMEARKQELMKRFAETDQIYKEKEKNLQEQLKSYGFGGYGFQLSFTRAWEDLYRSYENFQETQENLSNVQKERSHIFELWKEKVEQFHEQPNFVEAHEGNAICRRIQEKRQVQAELNKNQQELALEQQRLRKVEENLCVFQARVGKVCSSEEVVCLVQACKEYRGLQDSVDLLEKQYEKKRADLEGVSKEGLDLSREELEQQIRASCIPKDFQSDLATKIGVLKERVRERENAREGMRLLREEERAYEELEKAWYSKVGNILVELLKEEAEALFVKKCQPVVVQRARAWFQLFTQRKFYLEASKHDYSITYGARNVTSGIFHPLDQLSRGTRIQLLLAIRFAFVLEEERTRELHLPLFLDEVLAHNDPEAQGAVLEVLEELVNTGQQVVYFTCHPRLVDMWRKKFGDKVAVHQIAISDPLGGQGGDHSVRHFQKPTTSWGELVQELNLPGLKEGQPLELVPAQGLTITAEEIRVLHELNIFYVGDLQGVLSAKKISGEYAALFRRRLEIFSQAYSLYQQGRASKFSQKELIDAGIVEDLEVFWEVALETNCQAHLFLSRLRTSPLGKKKRVVDKKVLDKLSKIFMARKCWSPHPQLGKEAICDLLLQKGFSNEENEFLQQVVYNFLP